MSNKQLSTVIESFESYHQRNCKICRHPERPAIEYDFLHWRSPLSIGNEYQIPWRSIYRHAHAVGLFDQRRLNLRSSLESLIEGASRVTPTADGVLRAIELYARMNDSGEIAQVPKTQIIVVSRDGVPAGMQTIGGVNIQTLPATELIKIDHQLDNPCRTESELSH